MSTGPSNSRPGASTRCTSHSSASTDTPMSPLPPELAGRYSSSEEMRHDLDELSAWSALLGQLAALTALDEREWPSDLARLLPTSPPRFADDTSELKLRDWLAILGHVAVLQRNAAALEAAGLRADHLELRAAHYLAQRLLTLLLGSVPPAAHRY